MNNAKNKKRSVIIAGALAAAFVVPLVAMATVYFSENNTNLFNTTNVKMNAKIEENDLYEAEIATHEMTFTLSETGNYRVEKKVKVLSEETADDCELRVKIVPVWYVENGEDICGSIGNYSDFRYQILDEEEDELKFMNSYNEVIFICKLDKDWRKKWEYNNVYEAFVYKDVLKEGDATTTIVSAIEMPPSVYEATKGYELHIDVIADTVQVYGDASDERWQ